MTIVPFLIVLLSVTGNARALDPCGGDRAPRHDCCCPEAAHSPPAVDTAAVNDVCCCVIDNAKTEPAETRAQATGFESVKTYPAPVAVLSPVARVSASPPARAGRSPRPPDPSTLLALKTSFLR